MLVYLQSGKQFLILKCIKGCWSFKNNVHTLLWSLVLTIILQTKNVSKNPSIIFVRNVT